MDAQEVLDTLEKYCAGMVVGKTAELGMALVGKNDANKDTCAGEVTAYEDMMYRINYLGDKLAGNRDAPEHPIIDDDVCSREVAQCPCGKCSAFQTI